MFLLAESGSSKTQWRIIDGDKVIAVETKGINPFFSDEQFILEQFNQSELVNYREEIQHIQFFGAGCSSVDRNEYIKSIFKAYFNHTSIVQIDHDMLAACIALFGRENGIACIIGTGSNSCVYNEEKITQNIPALGYVLGDEASGAYIGKEILRHYIYHTLPGDIQQYIYSTYNKLDKEEIFNAVYKHPHPNRYLASFSIIASEFKEHHFIQNILSQGFDEFIKYHILCYPEAKTIPIAAVGSIAAVFENEFRAVLHRYNLELTKVDKNPIEALTKFYKKL